MDQLPVAKLKYKTIMGRLSLELDQEAMNSLFTIVDFMRRTSSDPTTSPTRSTATRRALNVYAASLSRITDAEALQREGKRAQSNTYAVLRRKRENRPSRAKRK